MWAVDVQTSSDWFNSPLAVLRPTGLADSNILTHNALPQCSVPAFTLPTACVMLPGERNTRRHGEMVPRPGHRVDSATIAYDRPPLPRIIEYERPRCPETGTGRARGRLVPPVWHKGSVSRRTGVIVSALLLAAWLAVVIFTTTRHEYWRDEVRVLSLARAAHSPLDLYHLIRYEGIPYCGT